MKMEHKLFGRKGEWCSHRRRIQSYLSKSKVSQNTKIVFSSIIIRKDRKNIDKKV